MVTKNVFQFKSTLSKVFVSLYTKIIKWGK